MSVTQGGNGFPFLSNHVYDYMSSGVLSDIKIDSNDIPDAMLKFCIKKVSDYFQLTI